MEIYRIIDANINRLREGLRVAEDVLRYGCDDTVFIPRLKQLRHHVARIDDETLNKRILRRDSQNDTGFSNTGANENNRSGLKDLLRVNLIRCQEAARVLEESLKAVDNAGELSALAKTMRYELYDLEKEIFLNACLSGRVIDLSLYLVTYLPDNRQTVPEMVEKAIKGGVTAVQFRDKTLADNEFLSIAFELKKICSKYHVPFIINDRVDICLAVNADGVHLGQQDMPVEAARKLLGADKIIGISANSLDELEKANNCSADYIGFGAIFSTPVKETYKDFGVEIIPKVLKISRLPVVFIGGISLSNIQSVRDAGAKNVAVVRALMDAEDPEQAAKKLRE